jgi:hypothetical protein
VGGIIAAILAASLTHTSFAVVDNGGVTVTRQPLAVHQVVFCGGVAETVQSIKTIGGSFEVRFTPAFPAGDAGKVVTCST